MEFDCFQSLNVVFCAIALIKQILEKSNKSENIINKCWIYQSTRLITLTISIILTPQNLRKN